MKYQVCKVHMHTEETIVWREVDDPSLAYELGIILHQATIGTSQDEAMVKEHYGPWVAHLKKEDGTSGWEECKVARGLIPSRASEMLN